MKNNKGFTLIEILAVVIILSILLLISIPAVTKTITSSRKDSFIENAKEEIELVKGNLINESYAVEKHYNKDEKPTTCKTPPKGYYTLIKTNDKTSKSVFGYPLTSYVIAVNVPIVISTTGEQREQIKDKVVYYYIGIDAGKNGIEDIVEEDALKKNFIKIGEADENKILKQIENNGQLPIKYHKTTNPYNFYQKCSPK